MIYTVLTTRGVPTRGNRCVHGTETHHVEARDDADAIRQVQQTFGNDDRRVVLDVWREGERPMVWPVTFQRANKEGER
jgi:hypothetical protein